MLLPIGIAYGNYDRGGTWFCDEENVTFEESDYKKKVEDVNFVLTHYFSFRPGFVPKEASQAIVKPSLEDIGLIAQCLKEAHGVNPDDIAMFNQAAQQVFMVNMDELKEIAPTLVKYLTMPEFEDAPVSESKTIESVEPELEPVAELESEPVCVVGTHEENGVCVPDERGGGCLIATATYGSELAPQVQQLREIRDNSLLQTESGSAFMESFNQFYYSFSPVIADLERENPVFKEMVKITITPLLTSLSILNYVNIDSDESVLGYGIGVILLNVGMYFAAPTIVIVKLKKFVKWNSKICWLSHDKVLMKC